MLFVTVFLTGCGTFLSRTGDNFFGAYPYQAVGTDVAYVAEGHMEMKVATFLSIPFDTVLDTLLLPPDLIFWLKGKEKDGLLSGVH